jgi:hypothetical protein
MSTPRERVVLPLIGVIGLLVVGGALAAAAQQDTAGWQEVEKALGVSGSVQPGDVYKVSLPRTDLDVTADGAQVKPAFALGSWLAFKKAGEHAVVMGDLVLTEDEVNPVMSKLAEGGIEVTAVHHHLDNLEPNVMFMHVGAQGDAGELAQALRAGLEQSNTPIEQTGKSSGSQDLALDTAQLDEIIGHEGKASGGVYQFAIPRAGEITMNGMTVPPAMGMATAINFQPMEDGKAAITGDFVMVADEVNPVLRTLRAHDIEVTALHNHMLEEEPRLFFMHFWANDDAQKLARGLRAALDQMNIAKS